MSNFNKAVTVSVLVIHSITFVTVSFVAVNLLT